ncbi:hypothetical protein KKC_10876, partial [Listeria fleischmannii subsp. coloradonensis]
TFTNKFVQVLEVEHTTISVISFFVTLQISAYKLIQQFKGL